MIKGQRGKFQAKDKFVFCYFKIEYSDILEARYNKLVLETLWKPCVKTLFFKMKNYEANLTFYLYQSY